MNQKENEIRKIKESQYSNDRALLKLLKKINIEEDNDVMDNIEEEEEEGEDEKKDNNNEDGEYEEIKNGKRVKSTKSINSKDGVESGKEIDINEEEGTKKYIYIFKLKFLLYHL